MIKLCGIKMEISHFPDHTQCIRIPLEILKEEKYVVEWNYEDDAEMATLLYIVKHLGNTKRRELILPYIPNARMDRVKNPDEVFTLKYFCEFINDLKFDTVLVGRLLHICICLIVGLMIFLCFSNISVTLTAGSLN